MLKQVIITIAVPRDFPSSTGLPIPASSSLLNASRAPGLFPLFLNFLALTMALMLSAFSGSSMV